VKDLSYYLAQPHTIVLKRDDDGDVVAWFREMPGCITHGRDATEALKNLDETKADWVAALLEDGDSIPDAESFDDARRGAGAQWS
jgi:predicted RNase H-like HicB family nuclease